MVLDVEEPSVFGGVFNLRGEGFAAREVTVDATYVDERDLIGVAFAGWGG